VQRHVEKNADLPETGEEMLEEREVPGGGNREKLRQPLDDAEEEDLKSGQAGSPISRISMVTRGSSRSARTIADQLDPEADRPE